MAREEKYGMEASKCGRARNRKETRSEPRISPARNAAGGKAVAALHNGIIASSKLATSSAAWGPETVEIS